MLLGRNIYGSGVETLQVFPCATALIADVASPNLTEIASHNIYIPKKFYENVWKVFDKRWKRPNKVFDVNNIFLLYTVLVKQIISYPKVSSVVVEHYFIFPLKSGEFGYFLI